MNAIAVTGDPRKTLLVADDYADSADVLTARLRLEGFEVYTAYSGPETWALAQRIRPDGLLLDIAMPGLDGWDVARRVRQTTWGRTAMLIAITGFDAATAVRKSEESGFDHHMAKPVELDALLALMAAPNA